MPSRPAAYSTHNELHFLKNIGNFGGKNRIKCLRGYLRGAKLRKNWGAIDRVAAVNMAETLLDNCLKIGDE